MVCKIGIIGNGFVGNAMYQGFKECFSVEVYDVDASKRTKNSLEELVEFADVIFVCVPTPMTNEGDCDISIVENVICDIAAIDTSKIVVIKSTVLPGTTKQLAEKTGMKIGFNPEFLTEANSVKDFANQESIIIGADDLIVNETLSYIYYTFMNNNALQCHINSTGTKEAEMFKYMANCFLATKVIFANEIAKLCDKAGIEYNSIMRLAKLDKRLGSTHWQVPGPNGKFGYGGSCFPKDMSALVNYSEKFDVELWQVLTAIHSNKEIREEG